MVSGSVVFQVSSGNGKATPCRRRIQSAIEHRSCRTRHMDSFCQCAVESGRVRDSRIKTQTQGRRRKRETQRSSCNRNSDTLSSRRTYESVFRIIRIGGNQLAASAYHADHYRVAEARNRETSVDRPQGHPAGFSPRSLRQHQSPAHSTLTSPRTFGILDPLHSSIVRECHEPSPEVCVGQE